MGSRHYLPVAEVVRLQPPLILPVNQQAGKSLLRHRVSPATGLVFFSAALPLERIRSVLQKNCNTFVRTATIKMVARRYPRECNAQGTTRNGRPLSSRC